MRAGDMVVGTGDKDKAHGGRRWVALIVLILMSAAGGCATNISYERIDTISDRIQNSEKPIDVFYVTTRAVKSGRPEVFGEELNTESTFGKAIVNVPVKSANEMVGRSGFDRERKVRSKDDKGRLSSLYKIAPGKRNEHAISAFARDIEKSLKSTDGTLLIYLHGYDTPFIDSLENTAELSLDLAVYENDTRCADRKCADRARPIGTPISFSWPTQIWQDEPGVWRSYWESQLRADSFATDFGDLLRQLSNLTGVENLNIIAHSMGNRILMRNLDLLGGSLRNRRRQRVNVNVVMAAPDIDRDYFYERLEALNIRNDKSTFNVYFSNKDGALEKARQTGKGDAIHNWRQTEQIRLKRVKTLNIGEATDLIDWLAENCRLGRPSECDDEIWPDKSSVSFIDSTEFSYEWREGDGYNHSYFRMSPIMLADIACAFQGLAPNKGRILERDDPNKPIWTPVPGEDVNGKVAERCTLGDLLMKRRGSIAQLEYEFGEDDSNLPVLVRFERQSTDGDTAHFGNVGDHKTAELEFGELLNALDQESLIEIAVTRPKFADPFLDLASQANAQQIAMSIKKRLLLEHISAGPVIYESEAENPDPRKIGVRIKYLPYQSSIAEN